MVDNNSDSLAAAKRIAASGGHLDFENAADLVLSYSDFVAAAIQRRPALITDLVESGDLFRKYATGEIEKRLTDFIKNVSDEDLPTSLRRFRTREAVRIAFRDLAGWVEVEDVLGELSDFADAVIRSTVSRLTETLADESGIPVDFENRPQQLVVLAMGKLGGRELNFSSDIDLIFTYPGGGETAGGRVRVTNEEFFTRLARRWIRLISDTTEEGRVFRVDMRLRPYGESGPLVIGFDALEDYLQRQGREWERYAFLKARVVTGGCFDGRDLLDRLTPFIYRKYLDFSIIEALREMKAGIERETRRSEAASDIKLGPGGIREVEFFGQVFQLLRGGVDPSLKETRLLSLLDRLSRKKYISGDVAGELTGAYRFLRMVENRLQQRSDRQTHRLPSGEGEFRKLAEAAFFPGAEPFRSALQTHMSTIHRHFRALLSGGMDRAPDSEMPLPDAKVLLSGENRETACRLLSTAGWREPEKALAVLEDLGDDASSRVLSPAARRRLESLIPLVLAAAGKTNDPHSVLRRIAALLKTIQRRTTYLYLLLEHPDALSVLVKLAEQSSWIIWYVTRHPVLLDELVDPRLLYSPPGRDELQAELNDRIEGIDRDDLELLMETLRIFKQVNVLRVASADITDAIPLMRVSDHLTEIAETVVQKTVDIAWDHLTRVHGIPECRLAGESCRRGFAVIAYGKLGGIELGYDSDLDLVFLHAGSGAETLGGSRPMDTTSFFARLGQRLVHMLTTQTPAGILYETDMRLRPSGGAGLLVSQADAFAEYQQKSARTWEHQALVRARPIAGDPILFIFFNRLRKSILEIPRDPEILRRDVADMRRRMSAELLRAKPGEFDLKLSPGGIVDIEFLVQYFVLRYAHEHPMLSKWSDNVRIIGVLGKTGILSDRETYLLRKAYLVYRTAGHRKNLQKQPAVVGENRFRFLRRFVVHLWRCYMETEPESKETTK